ncbi:MAG: DUF4249 domain-containing protein [Bacteroidales bacterium]|nr:DUF4249 domain-containing protein [Bacteroidales bacterium]
MKSVTNHIETIFPLIAILEICLLISCEERFTPEIEGKDEKLLVVEGMITNLPGPYTVTLSVSSSPSEPFYTPISGYSVSIQDDAGNSETLSETDPGTYLTSLNGIQGISGRKYRLVLTSPEGKNYQTDYEMLNEPIKIDSVYAEIEYTQIDESPYQLPGYRFFVDAKEAQNDSTCFLWRLEETYQYESDFKIYFSYFDRIVHPVINKDTLKRCWLTEKIKGFYLTNTFSLSSPEVERFPFHLVPTDNRKLSIRYSLLTWQYVISKEAYIFWHKVIEQNTESDDLFTKQPYQIRGNIYNPTDNGETVLGYFLTAAVSQKRIFVNRPGYPIEMYYPKCELNINDYENYGWMFLGPAPPASNPLFVTEDANGERALTHQACVNCLLKGGTTEKPEFWIDY